MTVQYDISMSITKNIKVHISKCNKYAPKTSKSTVLDNICWYSYKCMRQDDTGLDILYQKSWQCRIIGKGKRDTANWKNQRKRSQEEQTILFTLCRQDIHLSKDSVSYSSWHIIQSNLCIVLLYQCPMNNKLGIFLLIEKMLNCCYCRFSVLMYSCIATSTYYLKKKK